MYIVYTVHVTVYLSTERAMIYTDTISRQIHLCKSVHNHVNIHIVKTTVFRLRASVEIFIFYSTTNVQFLQRK